MVKKTKKHLFQDVMGSSKVILSLPVSTSGKFTNTYVVGFFLLVWLAAIAKTKKHICQILSFLGCKVEFKFLRITMNITVINTKLLRVHAQKINTWTLRNDLEDKFAFNLWEISVFMFFGAVIIQHWNPKRKLSFSTWIRFFDAWTKFPKYSLKCWWKKWWWIPLHHPFLESPTKQIQAIHFLWIPCEIVHGFSPTRKKDFVVLSELSPTGRQCRPRAPQDIAQDWWLQKVLFNRSRQNIYNMSPI